MNLYQSERESLDLDKQKISLFLNEELKKSYIQEKMVFAITNHHHIIYINHVFKDKLGYSLNDVYDMDLSELLSLEKYLSLPVSKESFLKPLQYDCEVKHKEGNRLKLNIHFYPIEHENRVIGHLGIARDITEEHLVYQKFKRKEGTFHHIVEESSITTLIETNEKIIYINDKGMALFNIKVKGSIIGQKLVNYIAPDDQKKFNKVLQKVKQEASSQIIKMRILDYKGDLIVVEVKIVAIEGEENTVCYLIREMADEMIMEDLMMQNDKLSVSGQLAAGIAHEVRNPLTSIKGFMQLIKRGELIESEHFDIINSEIKRIDFLLKELLTLARPQKPVFETIDLCSTIEHIVTLLNTQAILHNVILEKIFSHAHFWINADQNHMKQIFINFIKNAIEAMPTGGCVQLSLKKVMGNQVEVTIRDQGEGIPACVLKNIGQLFLTTKEDGIGLGLVVSMNLIKQNNGLIHIDSNDHGTSIKVRFPLVQES